MSVLQLSNKTINTISKLFRESWCSENEERREFHSTMWSKICKPIDEGRLGIGDMRSNNLASLTSQNLLEMSK